MNTDIDHEQVLIIVLLRSIGCSVITTSMMIYSGFPYIFVGYRGSNYLVAIVPANGAMGKSEAGFKAELVARWRGRVEFIARVADVLPMVDGWIAGREVHS